MAVKMKLQAMTVSLNALSIWRPCLISSGSAELVRHHSTSSSEVRFRSLLKLSLLHFDHPGILLPASHDLPQQNGMFFLFHACADILADTAALQIPYLLSLAGLFSSYLPAFPFASGPTFRIAKRFDAAFAYLLHRPPAFERGVLTRGHEVSATAKVRIKSLISSTRVAAVETAEKSGHSPSVMDMSDEEETEEEDDEPATGDENQNGGIGHHQVSRGLAKIYQRTLELLGDELV